MLIQSSTLWCQDSVKVAYTDLKEILILASAGEKMDSLVSAYELQIEIKEGKITLREDQLKIAGETIQKQYAYIQDLEANLAESERKRGLLKKIAIGLGIAVIGETFILFVLN
jgi:PIN domain nuclease of toxin-antitoxin system